MSQIDRSLRLQAKTNKMLLRGLFLVVAVLLAAPSSASTGKLDRSEGIEVLRTSIPADAELPALRLICESTSEDNCHPVPSLQRATTADDQKPYDCACATESGRGKLAVVEGAPLSG
jgi:hypothetical protein